MALLSILQTCQFSPDFGWAELAWDANAIRLKHFKLFSLDGNHQVHGSQMGGKGSLPP